MGVRPQKSYQSPKICFIPSSNPHITQLLSQDFSANLNLCPNCIVTKSVSNKSQKHYVLQIDIIKKVPH